MIDIEHLSSFYPIMLRPFKKNILREYLQYKILEIIYNSKYLDKLVFMGGTAIRIIHANSRFSEDLDFDNLGLSTKDFIDLGEIIKKKLQLEGYKIEIVTKIKKAFRCYVKFLELLSQTGITGHANAKLNIQVDAVPQNYNYRPEKILIYNFEILTSILMVPQDLLLAQKICAIFTRPRPQGRDFFDVIFMHSKTKPDMDYLSAKLSINSSSDLKNKLLNHCKDFDFLQLSKDLAPFIFNPNDAKKVVLFMDYIKTKFI